MNDNLSDLFPHLIVICKSKQHSWRGIWFEYNSTTYQLQQSLSPIQYGRLREEVSQFSDGKGWMT